MISDLDEFESESVSSAREFFVHHARHTTRTRRIDGYSGEEQEGRWASFLKNAFDLKI